MEQHLAKQDFFTEDYSIADIALFAHTHVSHEGGFPLYDFPKIRAWIERVIHLGPYNSLPHSPQKRVTTLGWPVTCCLRRSLG
jgi:glutathione S-transferase